MSHVCGHQRRQRLRENEREREKWAKKLMTNQQHIQNHQRQRQEISLFFFLYCFFIVVAVVVVVVIVFFGGAGMTLMRRTQWHKNSDFPLFIHFFATQNVKPFSFSRWLNCFLCVIGTHLLVFVIVSLLLLQNPLDFHRSIYSNYLYLWDVTKNKIKHVQTH